jgi:hypothetical protein
MIAEGPSEHLQKDERDVMSPCHTHTHILLSSSLALSRALSLTHI